MAREIRKIASQEMGIYTKELHENGSVLQLTVGSSTGMNSLVVKDNVEFIEEDTQDKTGIERQDPLGRGGRRHPADPQRRRDHGLARERRRLRHASSTRPA